jgi:glyoxylase-like metal-dependent hydrolase (beta-lactamase superfamily II)
MHPLMARRLDRMLLAVILTADVCALTGCDFDIQPLGSVEGRTLVYVAVGRLGAPNAGIICTRTGCVVIDPMLSPVAGAALQTAALAKSRAFWDGLHAARKERQRTQAPPVLYVLNTTYRANHTFGNQEYDKADIISTPKAKLHMETDGRAMREELRDVWHVPGLENQYTAPATLTVDGTMNIDTPEVKIQFISMGDCAGEGDAVVYLPGQKVLFAGDMALPDYVPYYKGRSPTVRNWIAALKKLEGWEIDTVVPGHGPLARKDALRVQREFLEALVGEVDQAIKAGKNMEQAAQTVKLPKYEHWARYTEWLPENVKLVYRELKGEPSPANAAANGGAGLVEPKLVERPDAFRDK